MGRKIFKKKYYRIILRLTSPLAIGSGENAYTDKDIIRDSRGIPYIPASAIAGVSRSFFPDADTPGLAVQTSGRESNVVERADTAGLATQTSSRESSDVECDGAGNGGTVSDEAVSKGVENNRAQKVASVSEPYEAQYYFGYVSRDGSGSRSESAVVFYDAVMLPEDVKVYHTSVRDGVKLDAYKNAVHGAKYDMEILEPGVRFGTFLEQNFYQKSAGEDEVAYAASGAGENGIQMESGGEEDIGKKIIAALNTGQAVFGGKSTRGYGAFVVETEKLREVEFDLEDAEGVKAWLSFDPYNDKAWEGTTKSLLAAQTEKQLRLELRLKGGISIRRYTTGAAESAENQNVPDFMPLTVHGTEKEKHPVPVIPGTSWAGTFRHHMKKLRLSEEEERCLFGDVEEGTGRKAKSVIRFGESQLSGGSFQTFSRNAIDRFTGGTVQGALFTEETYYGGRTELCISFRPNRIPEKSREHISSVLAAALLDLHYGFLAVGGETSIGRGIFEIKKVIPVAKEENSAEENFAEGNCTGKNSAEQNNTEGIRLEQTCAGGNHMEQNGTERNSAAETRAGQNSADPNGTKLYNMLRDQIQNLWV